MDALQQVNGIGSFGLGMTTGLSAFSPGAASARCAGGCCGGGMPMGGLDAMGGLSMMMFQNQMLTQMLQMLLQLMRGSGSPASAGGASLPGGGSLPATGGGGGSAPSATTGAPGAGAADPSQFSGGTDAGRRLAAEAQKEATNGDSQGGWCYRDVGRALSKIGINVSGGSAYMAADQLAKNPKVKEIKVSQGDLGKLPPGAIVVWDKGPGHPHGHISVSLGNGKEASDILRNQITNYGTSFRVFMPV